MTDIDIALSVYNDLKAEMEEHEQKEPIGFQYDKEDKYYWSKHFQMIWNEIKFAENTLNRLLDDQLDEYFSQDLKRQSKIMYQWDKKAACMLLKERLGIQFSASIKDLFLYVGRSVMCIPDEYKTSVINGFAHALDEWANVDIDTLREAILNIGTKMEERCYHCNELMPDFEGTGHAICSDCL